MAIFTEVSKNAVTNKIQVITHYVNITNKITKFVILCNSFKVTGFSYSLNMLPNFDISFAKMGGH